MRIAIIADMHGNHLALESVLKEIKKEGIDTVFAAGDYVGYYYHPDEIFNLLNEYPIETIKGNHDQILLDIYKGNRELRDIYRKKYGSSMDIAIERLSNKQIDFISEMAEKKTATINGHKILLCHGSPWDINEYIYSDSPPETFERFIHEGYDIVIMGHTHYPMSKHIGRVWLINPGSVGQSRAVPSGAHWALLDIDKMKIEQRVVDYNIESVANEAMQIDPDLSYLHQVLLRR